MLPLVQFFNPGVRITLIMVTAMPLDTMETIADTLGGIIAGYVARNGLVIGSTIRRSLHSDVDGILLKYSDTYDGGVLPLAGTGMGTTAPFSLKHWVGFFSAALVLP